LTFDLLTLKVVSESLVTWATSVSILVFLDLSVLELGPMYATDRQTSDIRQNHRLMTPSYGGGDIIILSILICHWFGTVLNVECTTMYCYRFVSSVSAVSSVVLRYWK